MRARDTGMTMVAGETAWLMSAEKGTPRARATFQSTLIVGVLWPSSIWPSIARLTPDALDSRSSDRPRSARNRFRLAPTIGVRSDDSGTSSAGLSGEAALGAAAAREVDE